MAPTDTVGGVLPAPSANPPADPATGGPAPGATTPVEPAGGFGTAPPADPVGAGPAPVAPVPARGPPAALYEPSSSDPLSSEPSSGLAPAPTGDPAPLPVPESSAGLGSGGPAPASTAAGEIAGALGRIVGDALESYTRRVAEEVGKVAQALGALLGQDGGPKPVEEIIEEVGDLAGGLIQKIAGALGALLGSGGPEPAGGIVEEVGALAGNLARTLGGALDGALGALLVPVEIPARGPLAAAGGVPPFATHHEYHERATDVLGGALGHARSLAGDLAHRLSGGHLRAARAAVGAPAQPSTPPPAAPIPAPVPAGPFSPGTSAPAGYSASLGASGSSTEAFLILLAVLATCSLALLQGGKPYWHLREPLRPRSALRLAIERPG